MDAPGTPSPAVLAFAATAAGAIALLSPPGFVDEAAPRPLILAPPPPHPDAIRRLIGLVDVATGSGAVVVYRPGGLSSLAGLDRRWSEVRLPEGAERFERVRLPSRLAERGSVVVSGLASGDGIADSPVGLLAAFAHPRQRIAAAAGRDPALLGELASAVPVRALLAAGHVAGMGVACSAPDLPTAQLLWAVLSRMASDGTEAAAAAVAWERPEVQRVIALCPGPARPQDLVIRLAVAEALSGSADDLADRLRLALGPVAIERGSG